MTYPHPAPRRTHPAVWAALVLAVMAVAAVGWILYRSREVQATPDNVQAVEAFQSAAAAQNALPDCSAVFIPGRTVDEATASAGCKDPTGQVRYVGAFTCQDGRKLYQVDADTGAPAGYGFSGGKYKAVRGDVAADRGYGKATAACND